MVQLSEILQLKGFDHKNIKVIRHTTNRKEIKELVDSGAFELYQSYQKTNVFIDRFTHKSYMINMNGSSYRLKETQEWLKNQQ